MKLEDLICIEENKKLFEYKFASDEMLMWPFIRYRLLKYSIILDSGLPPDMLSVKSKSFFIKIMYFINLIINGIKTFRLPKKKHLYVTNSNATIMQNGKYWNKISDPLASLFLEDSITMERTFGCEFKAPRSISPVYYLDWLAFKAEFLSKILFVSKVDRENVNLFILFLKENFPYDIDDIFWFDCKKVLLKTSKKIPIWKKLYDKLLGDIRPQIVIIEDACYGAHPHLLKWCHEKGIKTAEMQHGFIGKEQPAYNYGKEILNGVEYDKYLPNYFLVFGEYWLNSIRLPKYINVELIGNPHLSHAAELNKEIKTKTIQNILFTSSGIEPDIFVKFITKFKEICSFPIVITIRLHPSEKELVFSRYSDLLNIQGVCFSKVDDLYDDISNTDLIVGEFSTVLYEACAFGVPVFLLENKYANYHMGGSKLFSVVKDPYDLEERIKRTNLTEDIDCDYLWTSGWEKNYRSFLSKVLNSSD